MIKNKILKNIAITITMTLTLGISAGAIKASAEIPNSKYEDGKIVVARESKGELTETLKDPNTNIVYKRIGDIKENVQATIPEITFSYYREGNCRYYLKWYRSKDKPGYGYFVARQSNYWNTSLDTKKGNDSTHPKGYQKGYNIWNNDGGDGKYSLWHGNASDAGYIRNSDTQFSTGDDFWGPNGTGKTHIGFDKDSKLNFKFLVKHRSFTQGVFFVTDEKALLKYLQKDIPNLSPTLSKLNKGIYIRRALLEDRFGRDPGIDYTIYENKLITKNYQRIRPDAWTKESDIHPNIWTSKKHEHVLSGIYGNEYFNYYTPEELANIGFTAEYVPTGKIDKDDDKEEGKPSTDIGTGGDIKFDPNETPWTNKGKTGEGTGAYPIKVWFNGRNPQTLHGSAEYRYRTCGKKHCTTHHGWSTVNYTYTIDNITVTGDSNASFGTGSGGTAYITKEGPKQHLNATGHWDERRGSMPSHATGRVRKPTPPPNPRGSSGYYYIDWTKTDIKVNPACQKKWVNAGAREGYPVNVNVTDNLSGFDKATVDFTDRSYYNRKYHDNLPQSGLSYNKTFKLDDGMYNIKVNADDVAGNKNKFEDNTYYVDRTQPECWFSVGLNEGFHNNTQRVFWNNGVTRKGEKLYGEFRAWDNLSGLAKVAYGWTFGPSDKTCNYKTIYEHKYTLEDRHGSKEKPEFKARIEKPVGDNLYMHVKIWDTSGNYKYFRFGAFEDPIKLKNFNVADVRDPAWDKTFWKDAKLTQHSGVKYYVPKLPITKENNIYHPNVYPKKGYAFYFNLTSEYMYRYGDAIQILPTFYYWDGRNRIPVDLYYNVNNNPFIKEGSNGDNLYYYMKVRNKSIPLGRIQKEVLTDGVRLHKGHAFNFWKGKIQYVDGKEQYWYGKYYIPATSIFTRKGYSPRPENLLNKNNIIVNFKITGYKNGKETNSFVKENQQFYYNYHNVIFPDVNNQWDHEGGSKRPFLNGDVMVYDNSRSVLDDFSSVVTN